MAYTHTVKGRKIVVHPNDENALIAAGTSFWQAEIFTHYGRTISYRLNVNRDVNANSFQQLQATINAQRGIQNLDNDKWPTLALSNAQTNTADNKLNPLIQQQGNFHESRVSFGNNPTHHNFDVARESTTFHPMQIKGENKEFPWITYRIDIHVRRGNGAGAVLFDSVNTCADFVANHVNGVNLKLDQLTEMKGYIRNNLLNQMANEARISIPAAHPQPQAVQVAQALPPQPAAQVPVVPAQLAVAAAPIPNIKFSYKGQEGHTYYLAGGFNGWLGKSGTKIKPTIGVHDQWKMQYNNATATWDCEVYIAPGNAGQRYEFNIYDAGTKWPIRIERYVLDKNLPAPPNNPSYHHRIN